MTTIANDDLTVEIAPLGAELQSVTDAAGQSWLWRGDPVSWAGRAPILFPVVGRNPDDQVQIDGQLYPMSGHGFARISMFNIIDNAGSACLLRLLDNQLTRASFPFAFQLDLAFRLDGKALTIEASVQNRDERAMPFCFGFHPAFPWPLPGTDGRQHVALLDNGQEPPRLSITTDGFLKREVQPSPFTTGALALAPELFERGALVFADAFGDGIWYGAEGRPGVRVDFHGMPHLGIWTKPDAPFLCLEPWHGLPANAGPREPLERRRGVIQLMPKETACITMTITFGVPR